MKNYFNQNFKTKFSTQTMSKQKGYQWVIEEMENEIILGLRKLDGISVTEFHNKFKRNIFKVFKFEEVIKKGYVIYKDDMLYIPEDKIYVMNEIINMII